MERGEEVLKNGRLELLPALNYEPDTSVNTMSKCQRHATNLSFFAWRADRAAGSHDSGRVHSALLYILFRER